MTYPEWKQYSVVLEVGEEEEKFFRLSILPGESRGRVGKKGGERCNELVLRSME
jgi:hypothetical protein